MSEHNDEGPVGPDLLNEGLPIAQLEDGGMATGVVDGEGVLLIKTGTSFHAIGASCTHYGGPLVDGVFDGECVRCPWHHAQFNAATGHADGAPALHPAGLFNVEVRGDRVFVTGRAPEAPGAVERGSTDENIVIVGSGAAGSAAAMRLRELGFTGSVTLLTADTELPYDRPNLSKDFLAGSGGEDWLPLWPSETYGERSITVKFDFRVARIEREARTVVSESGAEIQYDKLLLATGGEPRRLNVAGSDKSHVMYLRTAKDSRNIIKASEKARSALVIGSSFLGLEIASSLRARKVPVTVVAPEDVPMRTILGKHLGDWVRSKHEENGVNFELGRTVDEIGDTVVRLDNGAEIEADLVVAAVGVILETTLASEAGLSTDNGVLVDSYLRTEDPNIWAAGDIARWLDSVSGSRMRVEHWVVAQRQGQAVARNMLGMNEEYRDVPFFWSQHYDIPIGVVGAVAGWEEESVDGNAADSDVMVTYKKDGEVVGAASIFRDRELLELEVALGR